MLLVGRGRVVLFKGGGIVLLVGEAEILVALGANIGFLNGGIGEPLVEGSYWLLLGFWSIWLLFEGNDRPLVKGKD